MLNLHLGVLEHVNVGNSEQEEALKNLSHVYGRAQWPRGVHESARVMWGPRSERWRGGSLAQLLGGIRDAGSRQGSDMARTEQEQDVFQKQRSLLPKVFDEILVFSSFLPKSFLFLFRQSFHFSHY